MIMAFCLPKPQVTQFIQALKDGRITPEKMALMTSEERRNFFAQIVGEENAKEVNAQLEAKLLLKDQNRGMVTWAKNISGLSNKDKADIVTKVSNLDKVLNPQEKELFLQDLAEKKLGVGVSADEMQTILTLSKKAQELKNVNPKMSGASDDYLKAREDLKSYIESRKPVSAWKSIVGNLLTIARNNLLLNPSTPIKATANQALNSATDFLTRRLGAASLKSDNPELASKANSEAWETFRNTGLNTASMEHMDDTGSLGEKNRFATPSGKDNASPAVNAVEAATRKVAQISNKVAIDWEHNISYVKFHQKAFFDSANVLSSMLAKGEKLTGDAAKKRAAEIFQDAARIEPRTAEGALVRMNSQKQAARIVSTNNTLLSNFSLAMKDAMNKAIPKLGDAVIPIAKIPANVIWNGIENSGVGIPIGMRDVWQGRAKIQSDDLSVRYEGMAQMAAGIQRVGRVIGVMSAAALFSSYLTKNDFKDDKYGGHFVKIGNVWINTEYISAISPALAGFMEVKKKRLEGQSVLESVNEYAAGSAASLKSAPGIDEARKLIQDVTNPDYSNGIKKYASDFFTSRGIPAFIQNLQKNRPIERLFFGAHGVETTQERAQDVAQLKQKEKQNRNKAFALIGGGFENVPTTKK